MGWEERWHGRSGFKHGAIRLRSLEWSGGMGSVWPLEIGFCLLGYHRVLIAYFLMLNSLFYKKISFTLFA